MVQTWAIGSHTATAASSSKKRISAGRTSSGDQARKGLKAARILFFVIVFCILFSGLTLMRTFASQEHVQPASGSEVTITADAGDTLWELAASVKKDSMDTRQAVHLLKKRNGLTSSALQNGQVLIVPESMLP